MFSLLHKTALVCGSTAGIGRAIAETFAKQGANVLLLARNEQKLQSVLSQLDTSLGQRHTYLVADFSDSGQLKQALHAYMAEHPAPIHILVNNTGGPAGGAITQAETSAFLAAFEQHLVCNHLLAQALLPRMQAAGYGRIINIISTSVKQPLSGLGVSNTIRAAVANWAKTLATEVAPYGITVNNVLPGATNTERLSSIIQNKMAKAGKTEAEIIAEMQAEIPAKRFGEAAEIAAAAAFLASPEAAYVNGINLPVDGGRTGCL